jgi:hypothetical protein
VYLNADIKWSFEESPGPYFFDTSGTRRLTNVGASVDTSIPGHRGRCVLFGGVDGGSILNPNDWGSGDVENNGGDFTFAFWYSPAFTSFGITTFRLCGIGSDADQGGSDFWFTAQQSGTDHSLVLSMTDSGSVSQSIIVPHLPINFPTNTGQWIFVVVTWNHLTNTAELWVSGGSVALASQGTLVLDGLGGGAGYNFSVGADTDGNYKYNGRIDEIQVFNRILSSAEILQLFNQ